MKKRIYFPQFRLRELTKEYLEKERKAMWKINENEKVVCELHGRVDIEDEIYQGEILDRSVLCPESKKEGGRGKVLFLCATCEHFRGIELIEK